MFELSVLAQTADCALFKGTGCTTFADTIEKFILPTMQAIVIGIAIIYLLYGAIQYVISAGEEKATKAATATLTNAAIGLAIALLVVVIIQVLRNVLGAEGNPKSPTNIVPRSGSGN